MAPKWLCPLQFFLTVLNFSSQGILPEIISEVNERNIRIEGNSCLTRLVHDYIWPLWEPESYLGCVELCQGVVHLLPLDIWWSGWTPSLPIKALCVTLSVAGIATMLLLLLLLVMLLPYTHCKMLKTKCPARQIWDLKDPLNHFKTGDYQINGLISTKHPTLEPYVFSEPPKDRLHT